MDADETLPEAGYDIGEVIGRGGMGEVLLARDARIGRQVAVKRMRSDAPSREAVIRFLREARIQACLDHPAIVPVHELGRDADGRPYFTMKRLAGTTLQSRLVGLCRPVARDESDSISLSESLVTSVSPAALTRTLLHAFVDVCRAMDFAHARRVVHRDLKPANIMLGEYGEVYVLDWGVARELGFDRTASGGIDVAALDGQTHAGSLLGTPGYMAPEQARAEQVDVAADIYSLGCILFEILAGDPAHPPGAGALASNLANAVGSPAERRPGRDIAPELDALCVTALASDPAERPTARGLAAGVQRYLDGDRDLALRRALSAERLGAARRALARTRGGDEEARATAIRAASHAFALDPGSSEAAHLVTALILEPPRTISPGLAARLVEIDARFMAQQWRSATLAYAVFFLFLPVLMWQGVRDWPVVAGGYACIAAIVILGRSALSRRDVSAPLALALNTVFMILFARLYGPIFVLPGVLAVETFAWMSYPRFVDRPWLPMLLVAATLVIPIALEALGVLASTWHVRDGAIVTTSAALDLSRGATQIALVLIALATVVTAGVFSRALAKGRRDAQRDLEIQTWHLRHLLPT